MRLRTRLSANRKRLEHALFGRASDMRGGQRGYGRSCVNVVHASALNVSVTPSRSFVSRIKTTRTVSATSTQFPPLASE